DVNLSGEGVEDRRVETGSEGVGKKLTAAGDTAGAASNRRIDGVKCAGTGCGAWAGASDKDFAGRAVVDGRRERRRADDGRPDVGACGDHLGRIAAEYTRELVELTASVAHVQRVACEIDIW